MSHSQMKIAIVSGGWGQNVGNAFFNVGGKWLIEQSAPGAYCTWFQDQPGYRTFHNQSKGNPPNHADLIGALDIDYIVLQGPLLTQNFRPLWEPTFRSLRARGTGVVLLSAGLFKYTEAEVQVARAFLEEYPPQMLTTRDSETFRHFADICELTYDGIESAFCLPDAYSPPRFHIPPSVAVCFDRFPEPNFTVAGQAADAAQELIHLIPKSGVPAGEASYTGSGSFEFDGAIWHWSVPRLQQSLSKIGQRAAYVSALTDRRRLPRTIGGLLVFRPEHRTNPFIGWKVYRHPGAVVSDEPFTYLATYANAQLTLSDRVHACVAALAYGRPAMLFGSTPRDALFERVGLGNIRQRPATLPESRRVQERDAQLAFLRSGFATLDAQRRSA